MVRSLGKEASAGNLSYIPRGRHFDDHLWVKRHLHVPLYFPCLKWFTCRRNWQIGTSMACLWKKPHCLWLQLSPLPLLWNVFPLFFFHPPGFFFFWFFLLLSWRLFLEPGSLPFNWYSRVCGLVSVIVSFIRQKSVTATSLSGISLKMQPFSGDKSLVGWSFFRSVLGICLYPTGNQEIFILQHSQS